MGGGELLSVSTKRACLKNLLDTPFLFKEFKEFREFKEFSSLYLYHL